MSLLVNDWGYAVDSSELNPNDPLVNTGQRVHVPDGDDLLPHPARHDDRRPRQGRHGGRRRASSRPATYEFATEGRYWTGFDRTNPIEGAAREKVWTGTAHALIAKLGVGSVTASALKIGMGMAGLLAGLGLTILFTGLGLVWATRAETEKVKAPVLRPATSIA